MLFLDKRIYKKTYLLLDKGFTVSKIKKKIKQYYNVTINQSDILKWFPMERKRKRIKEGRSETIIETPLRRLYSPDYNNLFGLGN